MKSIRPHFSGFRIRQFATVLCLACAAWLTEGHAATNATPEAATPKIDLKFSNGILLPRRPMREAIAEAMAFLKKADGSYVPGNLNGDLAGYFTTAHVNPDGSRSTRQLAYPARQHAYFIFTFLNYRNYSGEAEWLQRAKDLADWNLAHSTSRSAVYASVPFSTFRNGEPGGGPDQNAIEPDKAAFLGSAYIALYETTKTEKYLAAAQAIAQTLSKQQRSDGSWPFRVVPESGEILQDFGGAPVFFVRFFDDILRHEKSPAYQTSREKALGLMLQRNVKNNLWGTYHEDIREKDKSYLSAEPMSFTAAWLFHNSKGHPEYLRMGGEVLKHMEDRLVYTTGHPASPAPAVSEQAGFDHIMPGHTARYCLALAELYHATGDENVKKKALSGIHALTYMQSETGLFRTFFYTVHTNNPNRNRPDWYSQHLFTVCHLLEIAPLLPEALPKLAKSK